MGTALITLMLKRCAQAIEETVIPNLTEVSASQQANAIARVLHTLAPIIEVKSQPLREENEGMREVLGRVLEALRGVKTLSRSAVRNGLIKRLDYDLKKAEVGAGDVSEEHYRLKGALVEAINGLDALREDLPMEVMTSLREQIRSLLRQQIDHGVSRFVGMMPPPGLQQ